MKIFQRMVHRSPDTPTLAPHGAAAYLSVRDERDESPIVSGRFPVRGLELELPVGTYFITTWFRPYEEDMQLGPELAQCEGVAVVAGDSRSAFVRVQDDWTHCHFEPGEAAWNVSLRRGRMKQSSWWVGLEREGDEYPFLELGMPLPVTAVFLDVKPDARGSFRKLWIAGSLVWNSGAMLKACTSKSGDCSDFYDSGWCRSSIKASDFDRSEPTQLFVQRNDSARYRSRGCLITD